MSSEYEAILQAANALPVPDRVQLVDALISTLEPDDAAPLDDALLAEIDRRSREIDAGGVLLTPWKKVRGQVTSAGKSSRPVP
jgi:putative addiction module component (TIGR02574 family)